MSAPTSERESSHVSRTRTPCLRRQSDDAEHVPGAPAPDDAPGRHRARAEGRALGPAGPEGTSPSAPPPHSMTAVVDHAGDEAPPVCGAWNDPSMALSTPSRPIVGRTAEIGRLRRVLGLDGRRPKSATILVNGDAGIGKSRLVAELARETEEAGWQVTVGHGVGQAGSTMPYLPFTELISDLAGRHPELTAAVQRTHPALGRLLPPSADAGADNGPDAPTEPQRVAEAVHALL